MSLYSYISNNFIFLTTALVPRPVTANSNFEVFEATGLPLNSGFILVSVYLKNIPIVPPISSSLGFPGLYYYEGNTFPPQFYPFLTFINYDNSHNLSVNAVPTAAIFIPKIIIAATGTDFISFRYDLSSYPSGALPLNLTPSFFYNFVKFQMFSLFPSPSSLPPSTRQPSVNPVPVPLRYLLDFSFTIQLTQESPYSADFVYYFLMSIPVFDFVTYFISVENLDGGEGGGILNIRNMSLVSLYDVAQPDKANFINQTAGPGQLLTMSGTADFLNSGGAVLIFKYHITADTEDVPEEGDDLFRISIKMKYLSDQMVSRNAVLEQPL